MTKITWSSMPRPGGYVITASALVRGRQPWVYLFLPASALHNNIPMSELIAGAVHAMGDAMAEVARTVPATH